MRLDLAIRGGTLGTAEGPVAADLGIAQGRIVAIGESLPPAADEIDAKGLLVLPGGVDAHCHIDEVAYRGAKVADDFRSATRSAACGGTTTVISFADQTLGGSLSDAVAAYRAKAEGAALIDYGIHLILRSPDAQVLGQELPSVVADGVTSLKIFMTYEGYRLEDPQILQVLEAAKAAGALVMIHAENGHCVHWLAERLEAEGATGLASFPKAAPAVVEREATHRAIALAELVGARILLVHVSAADAMDQIRWGQERGLPVLAETCPQYLLLDDAVLQQAGWSSVGFFCQPPVRPAGDQERLWQGLKRGTFQLVSSDHCPYPLNGPGGRTRFPLPHFRKVPTGLPGIETRLPLIFHEGVGKGRLSLAEFVRLTATQPAQVYGLWPRKGSLAVGADADVVLWDPNKAVTIRHELLHDACDYTPWEGREVVGWPVVTLSRGERVWDRGEASEAWGRGRFLARSPVS